MNSASLRFNTNGTTPLADTSLGTAGTLLGTERKSVQDATSVNTANAIIKRDGSGNFAGGTFTGDTVGTHTGNASTATSTPTLSAGADRTKLDSIAAGAQVNVLEGVTGTAPIVAGAIAAKSQAISITPATAVAAGSMSGPDFAKLANIGSTQVATLGSDQVLSVGGWTDVLSVSLTPGTWLVTAQMTVGDGGAANDFACSLIHTGGSVSSASSGGAQVTTAGAGKLAAMHVSGLLVVGGTTTYKLQVVVATPGANAKVKSDASLAVTQGTTRIIAVRIS